MKLDNRKTKIITTVVAIVVACIIGGLASWFQFAAEGAVLDASRGEMEQIGGHLEDCLESAIEEYIEDLSLLSNYISESKVSDENAIDILMEQTQVKEFENLYYIDLDGTGISVKNEVLDFSETALFEHAVHEEFYISEPYTLSESNDMVFSIAVPIMKNGEVTAILSEETSLEGFLDTVKESVEGESDVFIVDHSLNFIYSTNENHIGEVLIPENDVDEMGHENVIQAQNNIVNGESGSFDYVHFGTSKIMIYFPIEGAQWAVALNVNTETINVDLVKAVKQLQVICQIIFWVLILLIVYIGLAQERSLKKLEKTAYYDSLTGLPNMAKLKRDMRVALEKNKNQEYIILIFDIQKFKVFNDMYGYEMGDRVLKTMKKFADTFNEQTMMFARIGDDKFTIFAKDGFLDDIPSLAMQCMEFYQEQIPELLGHDTQFKCGRYAIEAGELDVDEIINKASHAHKKAKETAGLVLCDYDTAFKTRVLREADVTNKMRAALKNKEYRVYLQPKFSVSEGTLVGAEALVRWIESDGNMIYPDIFIPLFEQNGFIIELDRYILENTCIALRDWMDRGIGHLPVSVNCSRLNISSPTFVEDTVAIVDKYNVPHEYIEIEITESTTAENEDVLKELFSKLRELGFKISIDDFGSGFSSLSMLKNLRVDTLKMDRNFFVDESAGKRSDVLIDGVVKLAHNLEMYVVAEGIETADQIEMLKEMNCDAVQGYFYSRPISIADFEIKYQDIIPK